jgi:hypothetical protein
VSQRSMPCGIVVEVGGRKGSDERWDGQCQGATGEQLGGGVNGREQVVVEEWARLKRQGEHNLVL